MVERRQELLRIQLHTVDAQLRADGVGSPFQVPTSRGYSRRHLSSDSQWLHSVRGLIWSCA
eukprot:9002485-Lingulodinium_polyedra.AAC.1